MKKITLVLLLVFFTVGSVFSQCIATSAYGTITSDNSGNVQTITTCNFGGEYGTVSGLLIGEDYRFASTAGYVTVTNTSNVVIAYGASPVTVNSISATTVRVHVHSSGPPTCGTQASCFLSTVQLISPPPPPPANDLCANAFVLTGDGTVAGTTINATVDSPGAGTCNSVGVTAPGVWYKFTDVSGTGSVVTMNTCSAVGYDTRLSVYSGSCGALTCVTANDDMSPSCPSGSFRSQVTFTSDGSSTYYVLVHGYSTSVGNFELNVSGFPIATSGNPPVIACPGDIVANNNPGVCSSVVNFADAIAFDIEDGVIPTIQTGGPASGSAFPVGTTTVEFSATDSDGNTVTCEFTVTVVDNENPVAVCQNVTVDLDPVTGLATINSADVDNGSSDNCGIASITLSKSSFGCADIGDNTVTVTVTDNSGNTGTCTSTVTVQDVTAPEITCVGGFGTFTESEDFEGASIPTGWTTVIESGSYDWAFGSGDMPSGPDFTTNAAIFDDDAAGSGTSNLARLVSPAYDLTGATSSELSFDYALKTYLDDGTFEVEVWDGAAWQSILFVDADQGPVNTGAIDVSSYINAAFQVRFTYDDEDSWAWGAGVDNFLLTYQKATGGGLDVYLDANGIAVVDVNDLVLGVTEACGYTITAGGGSGGGTVGSLTSLFASGNNGSPGGAVYFDITVGPDDLDVTEIDINTADPGTFTMDVYTLVGTYVGNEANPGAWGAAASTASGTGAGQDSPSNAVLATPITLTANTTYGIALVLDTTHSHYYTNGDGSNQNYSNAEMSMALGGASNVPFTAPIFSPRIFNGTIHYTTSGGGSGLNLTCADLGENIIEVTVTDDSGNAATCMAVVNVIDNIAPILVCADATIELGPDGTATVDPNVLLAFSETTYNVMVIGSDTSSGLEGFTDFTVDVTDAVTISFDWDYTLNDDPGYDGFGYIVNGVYTEVVDRSLGNQSGTTTVALSAGDKFGFRSQTDDNFFGNNETVISNFQPGFTGQFAPANWTLNLTNSDGTAYFVEIPGGPLSYDACGITILAVDVPIVTCADIGTPITVTIFASDASGNIASCTAILTVVDNLAPVITCPADQTVDPGAGNLYYIVPDYFATGEATAIDNCTDPVTVTTQDPAPGAAIPDGVYTVTLTATDEYGNTSTCDFELTVDTIVGVADNSLDTGLMLYPNPAKHVVNLVNKTNISLEKMMIYDINGKLVNQVDLRTMQGERAVDISSLASGVYVVQIIGDNASTVKRLIKE